MLTRARGGNDGAAGKSAGGRWCMSTLILAALLTVPSIPRSEEGTAGKKVLVVMSYHEEYPWQRELREGIEGVLAGARLEFFNLDTKRDPDGGAARAEEALRLYRSFGPDAVIACDDNAQSLFVVPYLSGKVDTPVVFCGVNDDASKYGYPAANVTGMLEKTHYRETLSFARLIAPEIKRVEVLMNDTRSNQLLADQIHAEMEGYAARISGFTVVNTLPEAMEAVEALKGKTDALLWHLFTGLRDEGGKVLEMDEMLPPLSEQWGGAILGTTAWHVENGVLCAVAKTGREQGEGAARMVERILAGAAPAEVPVNWNVTGRRIVNVTTAERLGIKLKPMVILGTELVR